METLRSFTQKHATGYFVLLILVLFVVAWFIQAKTTLAAAPPNKGIVASTVNVQSHACSDDPNILNCNGVYPDNSYCNQTAHTVDEQAVMHNGVMVGYVDLRTSPQCQTYWVRGVAYADTAVSTIQTAIQVAPDEQIGSSGSLRLNPNSVRETSDGSLQSFTVMTYQKQRPSNANAWGTFYFSNGASETVHA